MRANPVQIFGVTFILAAFSRILTLALAGVTPDDPRGIPGDAGMSITGLITLSLVLAVIVHASVANADRRRAGLGDCLKVAGKRLLPVLGVLLLYILGVFFAALVFIIPGLMLLVMWSVAIPVIVEERTGVFGAFGRAQDLTRGARWRLLGLVLLLSMIGLGIGAGFDEVSILVLGARYDDFGMAAKPGAFLFATADYTILAALWGTMAAATYVALRNAREGSPESQLTEIFA